MVRIAAILLANALTAFRAIAGIIIPVITYQGHNPRVVLPLAVSAGLSDLADGAIAKIFGASTKFGRNFDPLADATFCIGMTLALIISAGVTPYAVGVLWIPLVISVTYGIRVCRMRLNGSIAVSNREARWSVAALMVAGIVLLADPDEQLRAAAEGAIFFSLLLQREALKKYRGQKL